MAKREWTKKEVQELIEGFEQLPQLWDVTHNDYHNRIKKSDAFLLLANLFNTTKDEVIRKIHNLKNQFNNETRKIQLKKSGQGANEKYASKWPYLQSLMFLSPTVKCRPSIGNVETTENLVEASSETTNLSEHSRNIKQIPSSTKKRISRQEDDDELYQRAIKTLKREDDDYDVFGSYVAAELRSLKKDNLVRMLKRKIQMAIVDVSAMADDLEESNPNSNTLIVYSNAATPVALGEQDSLGCSSHTAWNLISNEENISTNTDACL